MNDRGLHAVGYACHRVHKTPVYTVMLGTSVTWDRIPAFGSLFAIIKSYQRQDIHAKFTINLDSAFNHLC